MNFLRKFYKSRKKDVFPMILFLLPLFITFVWFKNGLLFATAEEGAPFYSLARTAKVMGDFWIRTGTGTPYIVGVPIALFAKAFSFLEYLFTNVQIQGLVFFLIIFSGISGTYHFTKKTTKNIFASAVAGLFYFLNLFTMTQVWKRSLFVGMFAWAYFPLYAYLLVSWLEEKKYRYLLFLVLSSLLFSWVYRHPGYIFSFLALSLIGALYFVYKEKKKRLEVVVRSLIFGLVFLIANIWWIYPYLRILQASYGGHFSWQLSFESLRGVSNSFPISEILLLRQKFYFNVENNPELPSWSWGTWYDNFYARALSVLVFAVAIFGWWKWRRKKFWLFLSGLAIIGLFVSKGVNPPLGHLFYKWLFSNFSFTLALRNSYEKFGIVWLLPYAVFFGIGMWTIFQKVKKKIALGLISILIILSLGILVWPIWTGRLFENYSWVNVPPYYAELNSYINLDPSDVRILVLPLVPDHGARFTWSYMGSEPSESFFDKPVISKQIKTNRYYSGKYDELRINLEGSGDLERLLSELNVKYLVVRHDLLWKPVGAISPDETEVILKKYPRIRFVRSFGELNLYQFTLKESGFIVSAGVSSPEVSYTRVRPTKYRVEIRNAQEPYDLVFKESFNQNWQAEIDGKQVSNHFVALSYANSWKIDKKGDYQVEILFKIWPWD